MKFPVGNWIGEVIGDQVASKECYMNSIREGKVQKRDNPDDKDLGQTSDLEKESPKRVKEESKDLKTQNSSQGEPMQVG